MVFFDPLRLDSTEERTQNDTTQGRSQGDITVRVPPIRAHASLQTSLDAQDEARALLLISLGGHFGDCLELLCERGVVY